MVRRWLVRPDQVMFVEGVGEVAYVSRQAMQEATLDAEAVVARVGGHFSVSTDRHPTGFPGEMVTTAAAFEWRDRTDAKEQPEAASAPAPSIEVVDMPAQQFDIRQPVEYEEGAAGEVTPEMHDPGAGLPSHDPRDSIGDGLDESTLEEEDFDSVPESAR